MKEAAGEANMTVITIVLIALVLTIGTIVVTRVLNSSRNNSCCTSIGGTVQNGNCVVNNQSTRMTANWLNRNCPEQ